MAANLEICPTTGKEHWQGIACFNTVQPAGKVRGMIGQPTAHIGQRTGELSDCIAYCTKLETRKPGTEPVIFTDSHDASSKSRESAQTSTAPGKSSKNTRPGQT